MAPRACFVLRLMEAFKIEEVTAAVRDAIARGAIGFDAVKHLLLCKIERRPPRLDMTIYPYLPRATVRPNLSRAAPGQEPLALLGAGLNCWPVYPLIIQRKNSEDARLILGKAAMRRQVACPKPIDDKGFSLFLGSAMIHL